MPKISVIVPIYNIENYVDDCIKSLLQQTFVDFELLLIDDGSTDHSSEICKKYLFDERVSYFYKKNGGLSSSRNFGLSKSVGSYICFVDGDDVVSNLFLDVLYQSAISNNADICVCGYQSFTSDLNFIKKETKHRQDSILTFDTYWDYDFCDASQIVSWNKLYKKELFQNISFKEKKYHEDEFIIHYLIYEAKTIAIVEQPLYYYRQREGSIMATNDFNKRIDAVEALMDRFFFFEKVNYIGPYKETIVNKIFLLLIESYKCNFKQGFKRNVFLSKKRSFKTIADLFYKRKKHKIPNNIKVFCVSPFLYFLIARFHRF